MVPNSMDWGSNHYQYSPGWEDEETVSYYMGDNVPGKYVAVKQLESDLLWVDEVTFKARDMGSAIEIVDDAKKKRGLENIPSEIKEISHHLYRVKLLMK